MKKLEVRIKQAAKLGRVTQIVVERDYLQSFVLLGISRIPELRDTLVFKGGTALKKVHLGEYRFSEDLDYSTKEAPRGQALEDAMSAAVAAAQEAAQKHSPLALEVERYEEKQPHPGGQEAFRVRARFPWHREPHVPVLVEVTHDEPVLLAPVRLPLHHGYEEELAATALAYPLEEIAAEKLRSTRQTLAKLIAKGWARSRARDYFDLWHLTRLPAGRIDWTVVSQILAQKCDHRSVSIAAVADVFEPRVLEEVRKGWERSLGPFVPSLPDVEQLLNETRKALDVLLSLEK